MSYRRFCTTFLIGVVLIFLAIDAFLWIIPNDMYMDREYPCWMQQKDYIHNDSTSSEVLFIGDSACKAGINPEYIGTDVYNLALGGATSIEMCYALESYLEHHSKPKAVFIAFGSVHYTDIESYQNRTLYFHYLPVREEILSQYRILMYDERPLTEWPEWIIDNANYMLYSPVKYFNLLMAGKLGRRAINRQEYDSMVAARGHRLYGNDSNWISTYQPYEVLQRQFRALPSVDYYMKRIIYICKEQGIPVRILQTPVHRWDYELISSNGYLDDYLEYMSSLQKETGIPIEKEIPIYDIDLFGDKMHLNEIGAEKFSRMLKSKYNL